MPMLCTTCGATIAEKAIVCYRCGAPTALPAQPPKSQLPSRTPWLIVAVVVVAAIVAVGMWYLRTCCSP